MINVFRIDESWVKKDKSILLYQLCVNTAEYKA